MTDIFSAFIGKKKQKSPPATPNSEHTFVSYVGKDLSDDLQDFVVISSRDPRQNIFPKSQPSDKTSHVYPALNQQSWKGDISKKMGTSPSTYSNDNFPEFSGNSQPLPPPRPPLPPYPPIDTVPVVKQTSDEMFGVSSFLTGVPFQLSNKLLAIQKIRSVQNDGYFYLNSKAQMLENLTYDFRTERQVLEESETAIALGNS